MFDLALINGKIFTEEKLLEANIFVLNEKIAKISKEELKAEQTLDCKGQIVLPGLIDVHVHFREPGFTEKEDFITGSKAALSAGFTTVIDMPNNKPAITSIKLLKEKLALAEKKMLVNFAFNFGAANDNLEEAKKCLQESYVSGIKVFLGASTGNMLVEDSSLEGFFRFSSESLMPLVLHAEDEKTIKANEEKAKMHDLNEPKIHSIIRSSEAEELAVRKALELQKKTNARIHFCHVSSRNALKLILEAKKRSQKITFEVSPHHLFLTEKIVDKLGNFAKVNPSIKSELDQIALWNALKENKLDLIASDHAPHLIEEKKLDYWNAPSGMPGIETMSSLIFNAVNERLLSLQQAVSFLSTNPAKVFGLHGKGAIVEGNDADFAVIDLKKSFTVMNERLFTKCKWSAFNGLKLKGLTTKTIVNGTLKFDDGIIFNEKIKGKKVSIR